MTHRLFLLRHGLSTANQSRIRQGQLDYPLADEGRNQVHALVDFWQSQGLTFDMILSSPLKRASETAQIIAQAFGAPIEMDDRWMERYAGHVQGLPLDQTATYYADRPAPNAYQGVFEDGESLVDLHLRAAHALQAILQRPDGVYLIVAHGAVLAAAVRAAIGLTPSAWAAPVRIEFGNAAYAELSLDSERHTWHLARVNATAPARHRP